jgi:hypothetical protein
MITIHVNGVRLVPGVDFVTGKDFVRFSSPPEAGSSIHIACAKGTIANIWSDGVSVHYHLMIDLETHNDVMNLLNDAAMYYENPAVADVLEQLKVVVELVKQHS